MVKYLVYVRSVVGNINGAGVHSAVLEFSSKEAAKSAESEMEKQNGVRAVVLPNPGSKIDLFIELLKSNPVAAPAEVAQRAEEAWQLIQKMGEQDGRY